MNVCVAGVLWLIGSPSGVPRYTQDLSWPWLISGDNAGELIGYSNSGASVLLVMKSNPSIAKMLSWILSRQSMECVYKHWVQQLCTMLESPRPAYTYFINMSLFLFFWLSQSMTVILGVVTHSPHTQCTELSIMQCSNVHSVMLHAYQGFYGLWKESVALLVGNSLHLVASWEADM